MISSAGVGGVRSAAPVPTLAVLTAPPEAATEEDAEMRDSQSGNNTPAAMSDGERSPKSRNALGLTLPGSNGTSSSNCAHSIDAMLGCRDIEMREEVESGGGGHSPPRRIIHEAVAELNKMNTLKTPPVICEQGPSAPASPTSPSPCSRSAKRPCPLSVDALQRLNLLSPNYIPALASMDPGSKLPPVSPGYPTSDLGSSPRSSISASNYSALGINAANWTAFRDAYSRKHSLGALGSGDLDTESDCGRGSGGKTGFLSPHQLLSPAPFSPFSDYGVADLHGGTSVSVTPFSSRSPNLSPSPFRRSGADGGTLHFSFERSRSSLSNPVGADSAGGCHLQIPHPRLLDMEARERSRSESEALGTNRQTDHQGTAEESMDMGGACSSTTTLHAGQKRRLLHKSRRTEQRDEDADEGPLPQHAKSHNQQQKQNQQQHENSLAKGGNLSDAQLSRQPTIEEPPPSPTLAELFRSGDVDKERRRQVEEWIRQQTAALEAFRHSLVPPQQESNLLQVPTLVPQNSLEHLWPDPHSAHSSAGPIRPASLWRRSRSESDVSAATAAAATASGNKSANGDDGTRKDAAATTTTTRRPSHSQLMIPLNEATHVCEHCGQGFSMHDRLAKHIASRHRDRSASMNDENSRIHKCTLCPKSFGRSDMLTRHMRLHTGIRPYACHLCGQVFSRSDHLSTHQRTHTGEKPYRCPQCNYSASRRDMITRHMRTHLMPDGTPAPYAEFAEIPPINELSLNPPPAPPAPSANSSGGVTPQPQVTPRVASPVVPTRDDTQPVVVQPLVRLAEAPPPQQHQSMVETATSEEERRQQRKRMESMMAAAQLLSAAVSASNAQPAQPAQLHPQPQHVTLPPATSLEGLLNPHMVLSTLHAQLPPELRRSTPNLLGSGDYPSAFRPPAVAAQLDPSAITTSSHCAGGSSSLLPSEQLSSSAAAALSAVQQLLQQQHQQQSAAALPRLSLPSGPAATAAALPFLFRQHSFGGIGFSGGQQQQPK